MYKSTDIKQLAECYNEVLNEGFLDRFKKKKPEAAPAQAPAEDKVYFRSGGTGISRDRQDLIDNSKLVETIDTDPSNIIELKIYEMFSDAGVDSYRDITVYLPILVINGRDVEVGEQQASEQEGIQAAKKLVAQYQQKQAKQKEFKDWQASSAAGRR